MASVKLSPEESVGRLGDLKRRMWPLWVSAVWTALVALVHTISTPAIIHGYMVAELPPAMSQISQVLWHISTLIILSLPVIFVWATRMSAAGARPILWYAWVLVTAIDAIFVVVSFTNNGFGHMFRLPHWTFFLPLVILVPFGIPRRRKADRF